MDKEQFTKSKLFLKNENRFNQKCFNLFFLNIFGEKMSQS